MSELIGTAVHYVTGHFQTLAWLNIFRIMNIFRTTSVSILFQFPYLEQRIVTLYTIMHDISRVVILEKLYCIISFLICNLLVLVELLDRLVKQSSMFYGHWVLVNLGTHIDPGNDENPEKDPAKVMILNTSLTSPLSNIQ